MCHNKGEKTHLHMDPLQHIYPELVPFTLNTGLWVTHFLLTAINRPEKPAATLKIGRLACQFDFPSSGSSEVQGMPVYFSKVKVSANKKWWNKDQCFINTLNGKKKWPNLVQLPISSWKSSTPFTYSISQSRWQAVQKSSYQALRVPAAWPRKGCEPIFFVLKNPPKKQESGDQGVFLSCCQDRGFQYSYCHASRGTWTSSLLLVYGTRCIKT